MLRSVQATIDEKGSVHLLEELPIRGVHMAIVTILDEAPEAERPVVYRTGRRASRSKTSVLRETAGLWRARRVDGLEYQRRLRSEWDR